MCCNQGTKVEHDIKRISDCDGILLEDNDAFERETEKHKEEFDRRKKVFEAGTLIDKVEGILSRAAMKICLVDAPLASILMAGSILECVLLSLGIANRAAFERASKAPRDKNVQDWNLGEYIDVAYELGYVMPDVYKFSSTLRQFRNYIHPHRQMMERFRPDSDTAHICFHVLKAAIAQINERL